MDSTKFVSLIKKEMGKKSFTLEKFYQLFEKQWKTEEERGNIKRQINLVEVYQHLIMKHTWKGEFNSENADKLLEWQFDSDEEKKQAKLSIGVDDFICEEICHLWHINFDVKLNDSNKSKVECLKFLNWFFEPTQLDLFKKEKIIVNEDDFIKLFTGKCNDMHWESLICFFEFCCITPEKIKEIKKKMILDLDEWMEYFALKQSSVRLADSMIRWICPDEKERKEIITKFLHSDQAAYIIAMVVNNLCGKTYNKNILILFNSWIKGNIKIDKVRNDLQDCDYNMLKTRYICLLEAFLDLLEKGKEVKSRDIDICVDKYLIKENIHYEHKSVDEHDETESEDLEDEESEDLEEEESGDDDEDFFGFI